MANDEIIWKYLINRFSNPYGVAALMGNLYVESKLNPGYLESSKARKMGLTSSEYVEKVNSGEISKEQFSNDGAGFGLVQWTYSTRKEKLYDAAKKNNKSISDLNMQLDYMYEELKGYKTVFAAIKEAHTVMECSDIIVKRYEKPANQTEAFLKNRADYGKGYLDKFILSETNVIKVKATANVNIRSGNGTEYGRIGRLTKGEKRDYVAETDGWFAVKFDKAVGWVSKEFSVKIE